MIENEGPSLLWVYLTSSNMLDVSAATYLIQVASTVCASAD